MIPADFNYQKANSVDEALTLLESGGDAKLLAGGHSLIPAMKLRLNQPETLIDIARIPELNGIRQEGDEIVIGAGTTHHQIATSDLVKEKIPFFAEAADLIGDVQVRNMGTIGGSIAHADPAADWPALIMASQANMVLKSGSGERIVNANDFFTGFFETAVQENEIITEIRVRFPAPNTGMSYKKFMQPASRYAIVGCAVMVTHEGGVCKNVRVAFTGLADCAFRDKNVEIALSGKPYSAEQIEVASQQAGQDVMVMADHFASEAYRLHLAKVYAKRALSAAAV